MTFQVSGVALDQQVSRAGNSWFSWSHYFWLLVSLAVSLLVRVNNLAGQSLWNDEGTSAALAQSSLPAIVASAARDIHPPLYYLLLAGWVQAAGISEFGLRYLSAIAGVLVVALTCRIARELFDQDTAVISALLMAIAPLQVYYSQETRMYIWVTLFAALSVWATVRICFGHTTSDGRGRVSGIAWWILYVLTTAAALYTNYYGLTILLVENLAVLVWLVRFGHQGGNRLAPFLLLLKWVGAQVLLAAAFLPWLLYARSSIAAWPAISEQLSLFDLTWRILSAFTTAIDSPVGWEVVLVACYSFLFVMGVLAIRGLDWRKQWGILLCTLWVAVPLTSMFLLSLFRPSYNPKFLLLAMPGFIVMVARGLTAITPGLFQPGRSQASARIRLARLGPIVSAGRLFFLGTLALGTVAALQAIYSDPRLQRDDYRGILNSIAALGTERDSVVIDAPGQMDVVRYYYRGAAELRTLPVGRPLDEEATRDAIVRMLVESENLFALYWGTEQADPGQFVERALSEVAYKTNDRWLGNLRLARYAVSPSNRSFPGRVPFGDEIMLRRFGLVDRPARAGDVLGLELVWVALKKPLADYKVFVHLVNDKGQIAAQHDAEPQNGFSHTSQWNIADEVSDKIGIEIPVGTPPGEYSIIVGLYRQDTGERLRLIDGQDQLLLGSLPIAKRLLPRTAVIPEERAAFDFGGFELFGYNVERPYGAAYARGEFIPLALYWQQQDGEMLDELVRIELRNANGEVVAASPVFESYPPSEWEPGEIVRTLHHLPIPAEGSGGEHKIMLSQGSRSLTLTTFQVR